MQVLTEHEYVIVEDVPVFAETDEIEGLDVTEEVLQRICANNNARIANTGDLVPLILGHIRSDGSEEQIGELVGYAENFHLGVIGTIKPKKAILARFRYFKDKYAQAKDYTRRSAELWVPSLFIDPIALIKRTPRLDLGLTPRLAVFQKLGNKKVRCSMENETADARYDQPNSEKENMDKEEFLKECFAKLEESDVFQFVRQLMKERVEKSEKDEDEKPEPKEEDKSDEKAEDKDEKFAMQREALTGELERMRQEIEGLQRDKRRSERERDLVKLQTQKSLKFEMAEELELVQDLTDAQYKKHLVRMERNYQRLPDATSVVAVAQDHNKSVTFSREDMEKAVQLTLDKKIPYEEAVKLVKEGNARQ